MDALSTLLDEIHKSVKYRHVSSDVICRIGREELAKRRSLKEAIHATRNKLHQIGGAYLAQAQNYGVWLEELRSAVQQAEPEPVRRACARIMSQHASTRERLPILDDFYTEIFANLPEIHSVLDLACGYNPLAIRWMPLAPSATYYAVDIYSDMMTFLQDAIGLLGCQPLVSTSSILDTYPVFPHVQLALLLKAIPCLEQLDKSAGTTLLERVDADYVLVTYPVRSLGGRQKGMSANYESRFYEISANHNWTIQQITFKTELAFLVHKHV
jgi:16S rRNA (guanine(1405)-N(7))-methyltransferase